MAHYKTKSAFTLIEVLVALGIFTIFIGVVASAYISIVRGQAESNEQRKMIAEARYVMDLIADEIREGGIDYYQTYCHKNQQVTLQATEFQRSEKFCQSTKLSSGSTKELVLISNDQSKKTTIKFQAPDVTITKEKKDPTTGKYINESKDTLNLPSSRINNLSFEVSPLDDPYAQRNYQYGYLQFQPQITILLSSSLANPKLSQEGERAPLKLQTTISSRIYAPRE